jgi:hypothetical protein
VIDATGMRHAVRQRNANRDGPPQCAAA